MRVKQCLALSSPPARSLLLPHAVLPRCPPGADKSIGFTLMTSPRVWLSCIWWPYISQRDIYSPWNLWS